MRALSLMLALAVGASGAAGCSSATHPLPPEARGDGPATPGASLRAEAVVLAMTTVADWQLAHMSAYDPIGWLVAPFWAGIVTFASLSNNPTAYFGDTRRGLRVRSVPARGHRSIPSGRAGRTLDQILIHPIGGTR